MNKYDISKIKSELEETGFSELEFSPEDKDDLIAEVRKFSPRVRALSDPETNILTFYIKDSDEDDYSKKLMELVPKFVTHYQGIYFPGNRQPIDELAEDILFEMLDARGRGEEKSTFVQKYLANKESYDKSKIPFEYVVKRSVINRLINAQKEFVNSGSPEHEDVTELQLSLDEDDVDVDSLTFDDEFVKKVRERYLALSGHSKDVVDKYWRDWKNIMSPNFQALFKKVIGDSRSLFMRKSTSDNFIADSFTASDFKERKNSYNIPQWQIGDKNEDGLTIIFQDTIGSGILFGMIYKNDGTRIRLGGTGRPSELITSKDDMSKIISDLNSGLDYSTIYFDGEDAACKFAVSYMNSQTNGDTSSVSPTEIGDAKSHEMTLLELIMQNEMIDDDSDYQYLKVDPNTYKVLKNGVETYEVKRNSRGTWFCSCPGYKYRKICKHTAEVYNLENIANTDEQPSTKFTQKDLDNTWPGIEQMLGNIPYTFAGSLRRGAKEWHDIDLVLTCSTSEFNLLAGKLNSNPLWKKVASGNSIIRGYYMGVEYDFYRADESNYGAVLLKCTGSGEFNVLMRGIIKSQGGHLSERGLFNKDGELLDSSTEESIFQGLNIPFIEPEDRSNIGEFRSKLKQINLQ